MKRTPFGRGEPLARGKPLERGSGGLARGKRLAPRSENWAAARDDERDATMATFVRDRHRCLLEGHEGWGRCIAPLTPHHLRKQSQGGRWDLEGMVSLCAGHNDAVEDEPLAAHALGLVCRAGDTLGDCWERMRAAGLTH